MICPLKFNDFTLQTEGDPTAPSCNCEEEQCAWWVIPESTTKAGRCAIRELAEKTFHVKEVKPFNVKEST